MALTRGLRTRPYRLPPSIWPDLVAAPSLLVLSLIAFVPFAPLDPDPQHDGAQYAVALAVAEGLRVHIDVVSGYGPLTALIQGSVLKLFSPELVTLRVFNALLLAGIAVSAYGVARVMNIRPPTSLVLSGIWVLLCPSWGIFAYALPLWPWPSVVFTFFAQLSVLLFLLALRGSSIGPNLLLGSASALAVLSVVVRANQGVPFLTAAFMALIFTQQ